MIIKMKLFVVSTLAAQAAAQGKQIINPIENIFYLASTPCEANPCANGVCINQDGGNRRCLCNGGYTGVDCDGKS